MLLFVIRIYPLTAYKQYFSNKQVANKIKVLKDYIQKTLISA